MIYTFEDFKAGKVVVTVDPTDMPAFKREVEAAGIRVSDELLEHIGRFYISGCGLVGEFGRLTSMPHVNFRDLAIATPTWADFLAGKIAIKCDTREQYDRLMQECEKAGLRWIAGEKPTEWKYGYNSRIWKYLPQHVLRQGVISNDRHNPTVPFTTVFPADPPVPALKIIITTDRRVTTAKLIEGKRTVREAIAVCAPVDEFDFEYGAALAMKRLLRCKEAIPEAIIGAAEHMFQTRCVTYGNDALEGAVSEFWKAWDEWRGPVGRKEVPQ